MAFFIFWTGLTARASRLMTKLQAGENQKIVVYGTSLTAGGQWVADTAGWLAGLHPGQVTLINSGMSGRASNTAVASVQEKVIAHAPDTVFLEFAINDAFLYPVTNPDYGITLEQSRGNLELLIDAILRAKPGTEIILQTMNPAWDAPGGGQAATRRPELAAYYEICRQVAAARALLLIDHHANWTRLEAEDPARFQTYLADGLHPTAAGSTAVTFAGIRQALLPVPVNHAVDDWRLVRFTAEQRADPAVSGHPADPDGDGLANLLEYALGLDPLAADRPPLGTAIQDGHVTLSFLRRQGAAGLVYLPEASGDPSSGWASGPAVVEETVLSDQGNGFSLVRARDLSVGAAGSPRFLRLRVILE